MTRKDGGVMDAEYGRKREENLPYIYRYRVRALVAVESYRHFHPDGDSVDVLDLGTADGRTLLEMRSRFGGRGTYTGIERAASLIDRAPPLPPDTELVEGDVMSLPEGIESSSFDLCSALALLEHVPAPERCLAEGYRALRPGGIFVATCPSPFWDKLAGALGLIADEYHEREVTRSDMASWAENTGFETVRTHPFMLSATAMLPYVGLTLNPERSLRIDAIARRIERTGRSFVNQLLVAQKGR